MSLDMEQYSVEKVPPRMNDKVLRVLFGAELIGVVSSYAVAYDVMEEHATNYKPLEEKELSQEILYEREIVHLEAENAELRSKVKDLEQSTLSAQSRMSAAEVKVDDLKKQLSLSRDGQQLYAQRLTEKVSDYKAIVDKVNILWEERYDS